MATSNPFEEGKSAYYERMSMDDCPYAPDTEAFEDWVDGYLHEQEYYKEEYGSLMGDFYDNF